METIKRWSLNLLQCLVPRKMKTLEEEQQSDDRLAHEEHISLPSEVMEEIISRLPVKSILRFRSVSKPWLSLISSPSFTGLQLTHATLAHRTAFFITAEDDTTHKRYFLFAPYEGGPVTHLMTEYRPVRLLSDKGAKYLNGLVCSVSGTKYMVNDEAWVFNPSTRTSFKLPDSKSRRDEHVKYFFGHNESRNEHIILGIIGVGLGVRTRTIVQIMIFSMISYSWRKIGAIDITPGSWFDIRSNVCINSIIHLMVQNIKIWACDLRTEKFSTLKFPDTRSDNVMEDYGDLNLFKINGCLGISCHCYGEGINKMHIWILQDYENQFWVKKTITFPESWAVLYPNYERPYALDSINTDEIIFSLKRLSRNVISSHIYNMKTECFRSVQFTLNHPFLCSESVDFCEITCYVESLKAPCLSNASFFRSICHL